MKDHKKGWVSGLRHVQWSYNTSFHVGVQNTPYKLVYGSEPRLGMLSLGLPDELIQGIQDEDQLAVILKENGIEWQEEDAADEPSQSENENFPQMEKATANATEAQTQLTNMHIYQKMNNICSQMMKLLS